MPRAHRSSATQNNNNSSNNSNTTGLHNGPASYQTSTRNRNYSHQTIHHASTTTRSSRSTANHNRNSHQLNNSRIPTMINNTRNNAHQPHSNSASYHSNAPINATHVRIHPSGSVYPSNVPYNASVVMQNTINSATNLGSANTTTNSLNTFNYFSMPSSLQEFAGALAPAPPPRKVFHNDVRFIKLNSYDDVKVLIKPQCIVDSRVSSFRLSNLSSINVGNDQYKVYLRFCKFSPSTTEQMDCLPKSFNLSINESTFTIKNKYTFAPYDITARVLYEKAVDIQIRISIPDQNEFSEDYYYGIFLTKKNDHKQMLKNFKQKPPYDTKYSIDLVKKKLQSDDDDLIVANIMKVSLQCPLAALRIKTPARSKSCEHINCFDAEAFISLNEITPRWKCPVCKIYIKFEDLITDGLFLRILKNAPLDCNEAEVFPDGSFEYLKNGIKVKKDEPTSVSNNLRSCKRSSSQNSLCLSDPKKIKIEKSTSVEETEITKPNKVVECITLSSDDEETNEDPRIKNQVDSINADNNLALASELDDSNPISPSSSDTIISQTDYSKNYPQICDTSHEVDNSSDTDDIDDENNAGDDDDDDIQIVFEKIAPRAKKTSKNTNTSDSNVNASLNIANLSQSSHGTTYNHQPSSNSSQFYNSPPPIYPGGTNNPMPYGCQCKLACAFQCGVHAASISTRSFSRFKRNFDVLKSNVDSILAFKDTETGNNNNAVPSVNRTNMQINNYQAFHQHMSSLLNNNNASTSQMTSPSSIPNLNNNNNRLKTYLSNPTTNTTSQYFNGPNTATTTTCQQPYTSLNNGHFNHNQNSFGMNFDDSNSPSPSSGSNNPFSNHHHTIHHTPSQQASASSLLQSSSNATNQRMQFIKSDPGASNSFNDLLDCPDPFCLYNDNPSGSSLNQLTSNNDWSQQYTRSTLTNNENSNNISNSQSGYSLR